MVASLLAFMMILAGLLITGYAITVRRDANARALLRARAAIANIDRLAFDARDIDPHLSTQIIDEIRQFQHREGKQL